MLNATNIFPQRNTHTNSYIDLRRIFSIQKYSAVLKIFLTYVYILSGILRVSLCTEKVCKNFDLRKFSLENRLLHGIGKVSASRSQHAVSACELASLFLLVGEKSKTSGEPYIPPTTTTTTTRGPLRLLSFVSSPGPAWPGLNRAPKMQARFSAGLARTRPPDASLSPPPVHWPRC